jgi:hypothetical protein
MNASSEERDKSIKEIFEKHGVTRFWEGFKLLTDKAQCSDLISFEDCIIHFGGDNIFKDVSHVEMGVFNSNNNINEYQVTLKYKINEVHPNLTILVDFLYG